MGKLADVDKIEIVRMYQEGQTCKGISEEFGVTDESIRGLLDRRGVSRRTRKYVANEQFFDEIDSEEKAYWLGFLFADGNISNTTVSVSLNQKDLSHLQKFQKAVASGNELKYRSEKNAWYARVHSRHMVESLRELGCVERKSKIIKVPLIKSDCLSHFYRGHFDGDGWITYRMQSGKWKTWQCGVASQSMVFLEKLHQWVTDNTGRKFGSLYTRGDGRCSVLDFAGKRSVASFLGLLYEGSTVFLDRKKKICEEVLK